MSSQKNRRRPGRKPSGKKRGVLCYLCNGVFAGDLPRHIRTHYPADIPCCHKGCKEKFRQRSNMLQHAASKHCNERRHKCLLPVIDEHGVASRCPYAAKTPSTLHSHRKHLHRHILRGQPAEYFSDTDSESQSDASFPSADLDVEPSGSSILSSQPLQNPAGMMQQNVNALVDTHPHYANPAWPPSQVREGRAEAVSFIYQHPYMPTLPHPDAVQPLPRLQQYHSFPGADMSHLSAQYNLAIQQDQAFVNPSGVTLPDLGGQRNSAKQTGYLPFVPFVQPAFSGQMGPTTLAQLTLKSLEEQLPTDTDR